MRQQSVNGFNARHKSGWESPAGYAGLADQAVDSHSWTISQPAGNCQPVQGACGKPTLEAGKMSSRPAHCHHHMGVFGLTDFDEWKHLSAGFSQFSARVFGFQP